ncbi:MAG: hypothetical protein CVU87_02745 [Firmicutes bacterium HGW-Firmicutes-12]|jgi:hypothetical protein|nr:MAG: hypothetical protein CVU87_02745 [Firmicutes bacterium HGW-Firmicutes-12]
METSYEWLPELEPFEKYGGNWDKYLTIIYEIFKNDFIINKVCFNGQKIGMKRHPLLKDKECTFWHIISEGSNEDQRTPDLRRCERIRWPKPSIENCGCDYIRIWENERKGDKRILIWCVEKDYLVVLAKRSGYILLWTAYIVDRDHQKNKLNKEYLVYKKANAAL